MPRIGVVNSKEISMARKKTEMKAVTKARSRSEVFGGLAEITSLPRKQVAAVFDGLAEMIRKDLGKRGPGIFTVPNLMKIKVVRKPATKERKGVNPFTGEEMVFRAKPARNVVKVLALKNLKGMV